MARLVRVSPVGVPQNCSRIGVRVKLKMLYMGAILEKGIGN